MAEAPELSTTVHELRKARAGDRASLERLLEEFRPWIQRHAAHRLKRTPGDVWDVEDIVQETLKDVFLGLDKYQEQPGQNLRDWIARIADNNLRDAKRRAAAQKRGAGKEVLFRDAFGSSINEPGHAGRQTGPSTHAREKELQALRERAKAALLERNRRVLELREQGLSFEEIAQQLGFGTVKTARNLYQRAVERIRQLMSDQRPDANA